MSFWRKITSRKFIMAVFTVIFALSGWIIGKIELMAALKIILIALGIYTVGEASVDVAREAKKKNGEKEEEK